MTHSELAAGLIFSTKTVYIYYVFQRDANFLSVISSVSAASALSSAFLLHIARSSIIPYCLLETSSLVFVFRHVIFKLSYTLNGLPGLNNSTSG